MTDGQHLRATFRQGDPDDAREPDAIRIHVSAALRRDAFESECATGAAWAPMRAFGRT